MLTKIIPIMIMSSSVFASEYDYSTSYSNSIAEAKSKSELVVNNNADTHYSGSYKLKNVPDSFAPNVFPSAPCMGSSSIGGSGVGFGISFGTSWKDDDCGIRETARSFNSMGLHKDALSVLCSSEYAKNAPSCQEK